MKPNGNRLIIELLPDTSDYFIIVGTSKDRPARGKVRATGDCTVKVGDVVWVNQYAGDDFKYEGKDHKIVREESVLLTE